MDNLEQAPRTRLQVWQIKAERDNTQIISARGGCKWLETSIIKRKIPKAIFDNSLRALEKA